MDKTDQRLFALDLLRIVLCVTVMAAHYLMLGPDDHPLWPRIMFPGFPYTRYCSHVFFMISGFAIFYALRERTASGFLLARTSRLWPALMICPVVTWLVVRQAFPASPGFIQVVQSVLVWPLALGRGAGADWSYWTMTFETRFYIAVALVLLAIDVRRFGLWLLGAWIAIQAWDVFEPSNAVIHELGFNWYGPFFAAGALTYVIWEHRGRARIAAWLMLPVTWVVAGQDILGERVTQHQGVWEQFPNADFAKLAIPLICWLLLVGALLASRAFNPGPRLRAAATFLGAVSYPLYLVHQLAGYRIINDLSRMLPTGMVWLAPVAAVTFSSTIAVLITLFWAKPVGRLINTVGAWVAAKLRIRLARKASVETTPPAGLATAD